MKMMKKTLGAFAFIAALCFSLTTSAQFGGGPPQGGGGGGMRPDFEDEHLSRQTQKKW
jgi:hypothetical protein